MIEEVSRLVAIVPPPLASGVSVDWPAVFDTLGTELPPDYVQLIELYGGGSFDRYLWLLEPSSVKRVYDIVEAYKERTEALTTLWDDGEPKPSYLDAPGVRVIPWASTDNGEFLYWLVKPGQRPEDWAVLINEARGEEWEHYEMGCTAFLVASLTGEVRSEILWSNYPCDPHEFRPIRSF